MGLPQFQASRWGRANTWYTCRKMSPLPSNYHTQLCNKTREFRLEELTKLCSFIVRGSSSHLHQQQSFAGHWLTHLYENKYFNERLFPISWRILRDRSQALQRIAPWCSYDTKVAHTLGKGCLHPVSLRAKGDGICLSEYFAW